MITVGEDRQYGGNPGYDDQHGSVYRYDSNVANCKQVAEGDIVILRDKTSGIGAARVEQIVDDKGMKIIRRCPVCRTTAIKERARKSPRWRCVHGHEFISPVEAAEPVTTYEARFPNTYSSLSIALPVATIKAAALRPSDQLSIEELDPARLEVLLAGDLAAMRLIRQGAVVADLPPGDADQSNGSTFVPTMVDQRLAVIRSIKLRRGQQAFRRGLVKRYGPYCMVTGCAILDLLEAAHIVAPWKGPEYNHLENGLLLRADIHTLFDLNLMWIEPRSLHLRFHPSVLNGDYNHLEGQKLKTGPKKPSAICLELRYSALTPRLLSHMTAR